MGTMAMPGLMATMAIMERGLLRLSPLLMLLLPLRLRLIPGMDTMAMASTDLTAMDTTTERGLLRPSLRLLLLLLLRLRLTPGTDTTAMASTDLMAMDTTDTGLMATTGERSKECNFCQTAAN